MSGTRHRPGRRRLLSADDLALWEHVARRLEPARGKSRVRDVEPDMAALLAEAEADDAAAPAEAPAAPQRLVPPARAATHAQQAAPARAPPPAQHVTLERRKARRIARGSDEIEARLDLHGMTQADAHAALVGFVRRCHASGLRTVLVITGKGGAGGRARDEGDDVVPRPRGVLRLNVPRWLAGPEIGALVISYATAHLRHGGEGALYVRLRR